LRPSAHRGVRFSSSALRPARFHSGRLRQRLSRRRRPTIPGRRTNPSNSSALKTDKVTLTIDKLPDGKIWRRHPLAQIAAAYAKAEAAVYVLNRGEQPLATFNRAVAAGTDGPQWQPLAVVTTFYPASDNGRSIFAAEDLNRPQYLIAEAKQTLSLALGVARERQYVRVKRGYRAREHCSLLVERRGNIVPGN
jgi:hypothetical protein